MASDDPNAMTPEEWVEGFSTRLNMDSEEVIAAAEYWMKNNQRTFDEGGCYAKVSYDDFALFWYCYGLMTNRDLSEFSHECFFTDVYS